jgi:glycerol-3-phosphate acyltransferase PlsY
MNSLLLVIAAYFLGSIPTGYWVVKGTKGIDLLQVGSGSTGTTNVLRTAGKSAAAFVFFVDIAKGVLPVYLSIYAVTHQMVPELPAQAAPWLPLVVALVTLIGHSKSIFLKFKGGKSAATGLGTMMAMNFPAALCAFAVFASMVWLVRYVSLASITAVISSAFFMAFFAPPTQPLHVSYITFCAVGAAYVIFRHKENIKRLLNGSEPKIGQKIDQSAIKSPSVNNNATDSQISLHGAEQAPQSGSEIIDAANRANNG